MKNLVLCLDGTANEFRLRRTNVVKIFSILNRDPAAQMAYYHPGVGTMAPPGALTGAGKAVTRALGMAFGYGLSDDIRDAYVFLMRNYEPGDRIFIFGFSRGAYTARAVAALVHMYGLIGKGNEPLVPYAIRMMMAINDARTPAERDVFFREAQGFNDTFSAYDCRLSFLGLWDTVSSIGWYENPVRLAFTASNPSIDVGRHAIAIDERRAFFRTNLWRPRGGDRPDGPVDCRQVWFAGVHCDVGGGYDESESGLSAIALHWMIGEAEAHGLGIDPARRKTFLDESYAQPNPGAAMHDSLTPGWWPAEALLKRHWNWHKGKWEWRANFGRRRTIPPGSLIHRSAWDRGADYRTEAGIPADAVVVG